MDSIDNDTLDLIVHYVRCDPRGAITVPGLVADSRNRQISRRFKSASQRVPAPPFDSDIEYIWVGISDPNDKSSDGREEKRQIPRKVPFKILSGGKRFRSYGYVHEAFVLARDAQSGRVHALVTIEVSTDDCVTEDFLRAMCLPVEDKTPELEHPKPIDWEEHPISNCVAWELSIRDCVRVLCGNNADYMRNMWLFDSVIQETKKNGGLCERKKVRCSSVSTIEYEHSDNQSRLIRASYLSWYTMPLINGATSSNVQLSQIGSWATVQLQAQRKGRSTLINQNNLLLTPEITLNLKAFTQENSSSFSMSNRRTMIFGPAEDDRAGAARNETTHPFVSVPPLSAVMGFFDASKHAECGEWFHHTDEHGLSKSVLKSLIGPPVKPNGCRELYRRQLARLALDAARRRTSLKTAIVPFQPKTNQEKKKKKKKRRDKSETSTASSLQLLFMFDSSSEEENDVEEAFFSNNALVVWSESVAATLRTRPRKMACLAAEKIDRIVEIENNTFNTGRISASFQDEESRAAEASGLEVDDSIAGHNEAEIEDCVVDEDYDFKLNDRRSKSTKKNERIQQCIDENNARRHQNMVQLLELNPDANLGLDDL
ncbi:MAG: hypothetical protein CMM02_16955 [Rhodopirellula sp.]|jgi:hypothetical protein|nr:hypothetical protein [Rhodopirellula sp.]